MCYDDNARPPIEPAADGAAHGEEIVLKASDGNTFAAYISRAKSQTGAQVVILPDIRGLHQFYKELTLRFAEIGITAIAIDYFGRTAGVSSRTEEFDYMPHVQQLTVPTVFTDIQAAEEQLRQEGSTHPIFTTGFCLGGSLSLLSATNADFQLAGAISFYAGLARKLAGTDDTVLALAKNVRVPFLGLFGEADQGIPLDQVHQLDETLKQTGIDHQIITYPEATHGFFDRRAEQFADASADAWKRVLSFISSHTPKTVTA